MNKLMKEAASGYGGMRTADRPEKAIFRAMRDLSPEGVSIGLLRRVL